MHQRAMKFLLAPLLLLVLTLGFAIPSYAADTWKPQYIAGHHVYLDPALSGGANPVNLDGLEATYKAESAKNGVEYFFIMTLKGDETTPGKDFATTRLREIMGNWGGQSGFPADRAVLCYVVRLNTDWTKSAVACNVASELAAKGINTTSVLAIADHYAQHRTANPDALLPQNPKGFATTVAQGANQAIEALVAQKIADQKAAEAQAAAAAAHAAAAAKLQLALEIGIPTGIFLIVLLVFFLRKRKAVAAANEVIAKWDGLFATADSNYIELEGHYLDFLKRQGANWKDKFKGLTLAKYTAAITAYADLSARIITAQKLIAAAKAANNTGNIFSLAGNQLAVDLLTSNDVTIDSKSLSFEQQGLFGALLDAKSNTKKPDELLNDMDNLFRTTNSTMAAIMEAFEGSDKNKGEIEAMFAEVEGQKANLSEANLSFAAYQPAYDALVKAKDAFLAIADSDPLEAFQESKAVEVDCEALKATIGHAIELRKSLATTDTAINAAATRIAEVRSQPADYAYPDGGQPAAGAASTYLLNEAGSNPDEALAQAKAQLANAISLVVAGKLDDSKAAKGQAEAHAAEAVAIVATVLAAKETVQKLVPAVHAALDHLTAEIPGGEEALASLKAGFQPSNFNDAPGQLFNANHVHEATASHLAAVKAAFFEQRFVAASEMVQSETGDIQGARNGLIAIHTRLEELTTLRQHAKDQTASNAQTLSTLASKIAASAFTTSAHTDGAFHALAPVLANHQSDVSKAITDWPTAARSADQLKGDLSAIDGAIDNEKHAYDSAVSALGELRQAVAGAVNEVNTDGNIVRPTAHQQVGQAQATLSQAEGSITVPKSDWSALAQHLESQISAATDAHNAAIADKNAYNSAVTKIQNAEQHIGAVENGDYETNAVIGGRYSGMYGAGVRANCSLARQYLGSASQLIGIQRYEDAGRQADVAYNAATEAQEAAEAQVQALIQVAVEAWTIEENARIEAERVEAARLQAIADAEAARQQAIADAEAARQQAIADAAAQRQADADAAAAASQNNSWGGSDNTQGGSFDSPSAPSDNTQGTDFS
jgi:hypothetical protein